MIYNPYSVSKMSLYEHCSYKFKLSYIDKIKTKIKSEFALYKGIYSHKVIENDFNYNIDFKLNEVFTNKDRIKVNKIIKDFENSKIGNYIKNELKNNKTISKEEKFSFNNKLEICKYFDKTSWIRGAIDLYYLKENIIYCIDYKTGKDKSRDSEFGIKQSKIYAIYLFIKFPEIEIIKSSFLFIEHENKKKTIIYNKKDFKKYIKDIFKITKEIESDKIFKETIGPLCDYCDFFKENICKKPIQAEEKCKDFMNSRIIL